jgi:hypothetical protein
VPRLTLVLPDLYPARQSLEGQAGLPRLPALERWLARGEAQALPADWRDWLLARHAPDWRSAGPAAVAARAHAPAHRLLPGQAWWLATPVHFVAGIDTLRLHPAGLLPLPGPEQQALAADFARVFAGSGWTLLPSGRRELVLLGPAAVARTTDPARWLGADPSAGLPAGAGAAPLRRLGAELEMWLHEHPVNLGRAARRQLVATALWLWGQGEGQGEGRGEGAGEAARQAQAAGAGAGHSLALHGADAFLDGLAAVSGVTPPAPATTLAAALPVDAAPGGGRDQADTVVVLGGGEPLSPAQLERWDQDWFAPALRQWQDGQWQALALACGGRSWMARRGPRAALRGWRGTVPWWERLLAC